MFSKATPEEMIAYIMSGKGTITFTSKDLPPGGSVHNNSLYLSVICLQKYVPFSVVNNGSIINVYP